MHRSLSIHRPFDVVNMNPNIAGRMRILLAALYPSDSLAKVAKRLNITPNTLNNYLQGRRLPSPEFLLEIAQNGGDVQWLLTGEGTPTQGSTVQRKQRTDQELARFSDRALQREMEKRLQTALQVGLSLVDRVAQADLDPLAEKIRDGANSPELSNAEMVLARLVHDAFHSLNTITWWIADLNPDFSDLYPPFLQKHGLICSNRAFRTVLNWVTETRALSRTGVADGSLYNSSMLAIARRLSFDHDASSGTASSAKRQNRPKK